MIRARYLRRNELRGEKVPDNALGIHLIMELYDCDPSLLKRADVIESILLKAALAANLTVLKVKSHQFEPEGASSIVLIGESHLTIHTWPEYGFAAVDIFVCGDKSPYMAAEVLINEFKPKKVEIVEITRGERVFQVCR